MECRGVCTWRRGVCPRGRAAHRRSELEGAEIRREIRRGVRRGRARGRVHGAVHGRTVHGRAAACLQGALAMRWGLRPTHRCFCATQHTVMSAAAAARDSSPLLLPQAPPASSPAPWLYSAPRKRCVCGMQGVQGGGARLSVRLPLRMPGMLSGRLLMRRFPGPCASRRASRVACRQGERPRVRDKVTGEGKGGGYRLMGHQEFCYTT